MQSSQGRSMHAERSQQSKHRQCQNQDQSHQHTASDGQAHSSEQMERGPARPCRAGAAAVRTRAGASRPPRHVWYILKNCLAAGLRAHGHRPGSTHGVGMLMPPYGVTGGIWQVGPKAWPGITAALLKMVVPGRTAARQVPAHHRQASSEFAYVSRPKQTEGPAVAPLWQLCLRIQLSV